VILLLVFFSIDALLPINSERKEVAQIFQDDFLSTGRVSHMTRILAWHPTFYETLLYLENHLFQYPQGPIPLPMRNIVALMAAVRFKSSYIVQDQEREFRMNNGPPEWLKGYSHFPSKLQQLSEINAVLAHQPWRINKDHIAKLFKSTVGWTIAGLIDAILIMSHSRSMSAFALAMGLYPEVEFKDKPIITPTEVYEDKTDDNKTAEVINKLSKQSIWKPGQKKPTLLSLSFEQFAASATPPELTAQREENGDTLSL
jgi:hypothetical protein